MLTRTHTQTHNIELSSSGDSVSVEEVPEGTWKPVSVGTPTPLDLLLAPWHNAPEAAQHCRSILAKSSASSPGPLSLRSGIPAADTSTGLW